MRKPTLIVFARAPAVGVGKTRLARDIGVVEAWRLYRAMSGRLLWGLRDARWRLVLRLEGRRPDPAWPPLPVEPQGRGGLGERLERAIRAHARGAVAVVGTDAPDVTAARVRRAFRTGAAIGPADDGGFWLLVLPPRRARGVRLAGVRWSSAYTFEDTVRALGPLQRLETLTDIDDGAALRKFRSSGEGRDSGDAHKTPRLNLGPGLRRDDRISDPTGNL